MVNKIQSDSDRPSDREGQEPWSRDAMNRMPALSPVDVPNGVARIEGAQNDWSAWQPKDEWPGGNRTGE